VSRIGYLDLLGLVGPEAILALAVVAVLFVDLGLVRGQPLRHRFHVVGSVTVLGCGVALLWLLFGAGTGRIWEDTAVVDAAGRSVKASILVLTLLTAVVSFDADFTVHVGEYFALLLLATVGALMLSSTEEAITLFAALELMSLSLYALTAFNKRNPRSVEAGLKYFLFGGAAAAFLLFGLSYLYGLTGTTTLEGIARGLAGRAGDPLVQAALVLVVMGFGFKVAAVPFHLWAPDAYEGAPTPAAALIASGSKVASFYVFAKVLAVGLAPVAGSGAWGGFAAGWAPLLAVVAVASMLLGNLAALAQRNLRRLLAYSAVAHAGYLLVGLLAVGTGPDRTAGLTAVLYYATTYGLTAVGAFAVVAVLERTTGSSDIGQIAGLSARSPWLAGCLLVFLLSLAGIPPLAGFFGKFYVFAAALAVDGKALGLFWLVVFALAMSAISLFYYLQVLKQAYVRNPEPEAEPLILTRAERLVLAITAAGVLWLGAMPGSWIARLQ
jgi:NADH-quinone oxidoreductase subunit N